MISRRVVFIVVLELLGRDGLAKVEGERVEDVLLGAGESCVLRHGTGFKLGCHWYPW